MSAAPKPAQADLVHDALMKIQAKMDSMDRRMVTKDHLDQALAQTRDELRGEIAQTRDELRGEIAQTRDELRGEIAQTRDELRGEIAQTRDELRGEISQTRIELESTIATTNAAMMVQIGQYFDNLNRRMDQLQAELRGKAGPAD
ncbi:MAG TPA: hypothetical protein VED40_08275 [Azospirillaceae bacterium]|nr:hypothetical protein [Azospirillaceae bacterium]